MKKLMVYSTAILMMVMFSITLQAQDKNSTALNSIKSIRKSETKAERKEIRKEDRNLVSDMSMENFFSDFGKIANVEWEKGQFLDEALFTKDGHQYRAFYDRDSKLVGTTTEKTIADLPKNAQKDIKKQFGDYSIDKVIFFEDNQMNDQDMLLYNTQFEDADNYFVELSNEKRNIIIQVTPEGDVFFFNSLKKKI
jgi:hypothetical protein